jgi:hypothetical protein
MLAYERQELLSIRERLGSHPVFGGVHVARLVWFYVLCCVSFLFLIFVLCIVCALDSQPQVIKFTSSLPMVGGSLLVLPASSTTKT